MRAGPGTSGLRSTVSVRHPPELPLQHGEPAWNGFEFTMNSWS